MLRNTKTSSAGKALNILVLHQFCEQNWRPDVNACANELNQAWMTELAENLNFIHQILHLQLILLLATLRVHLQLLCSHKSPLPARNGHRALACGAEFLLQDHISGIHPAHLAQLAAHGH